MSGLFIALTGLIGIIPCFLYSAERNIKVKSGNKEGFFGFFEVIDDYEVAKNLFDDAKEWIKKEG